MIRNLRKGVTLGSEASAAVAEDNDEPRGGPSLSVVIPSRNRHQLVAVVVERLLADVGFVEVIVVDDGSTDGTFELLSEMAQADTRLRVLLGDGSGSSVARTTGALHARGDIVLFLDDDVMPDPGLPGRHLEHHLASQPRVVLGY